MHFSQVLISAIALTLATSSLSAFAQANVNENQTTFVYVDGTVGLDSNPGTQALPLKTVQAGVGKAEANNQKSIGTKVFINPGTYREWVQIQATTHQSSAPMTFQAVTPGTVTISGSDVWASGWVPNTANAAIYDNLWTPAYGSCALPSTWPAVQPIVLRSEMIFVNGTPLTQVSSFKEMSVGTFFANESADVVHIWPPANTNMSTALIEVSSRAGTLNLAGRSNVVLRGLTFQHARNCLNTNSVTISSVYNVLLDQVHAYWNNWNGIGISSSTYTTVQNSVASYNGGLGFGGATDLNAVYNFNESDYNNWRGAQGAFYDWGQGGIKLMYMHTSSISNHFAYRNSAQGLWYDTDDKNITISNSIVAENKEAGLQLEVNEGPITVSNNTFCSNGSGVNLINSSGVTLTNNIFYNNGGTNKYQGQIYLAGKSGGRSRTDWQTGQVYLLFTNSTTMTGNTFQNNGPGQYVFGTYVSGDDWNQFANTLSSNNNTWFDPTITTSFKIPNGKVTDLPGWQNNTTQDMASVFANSQFAPKNCAPPTPTYTDFIAYTDTSTYTMVAGVATATIHVYSYGAGAVTLKALDLPTNVTASFSPSLLTSGVSVLTLKASKSAVAQTVPILITSTSGNQTHAVTVNVVVVPGS